MNNFNKHASINEKATFSMGCFWGPDTLFGSLPGVIQTEVGYAGGTTELPTYRAIGDHSETIDILFDPDLISYEELVRLFWENHDATKDRFYKERQYISILFYRNEKQLSVAQKVKAEVKKRDGKELQTELQEYDMFYPAEDHHQKYFLRRFKKAREAVRELFPDEKSFLHSTIAARLNGFVRERASLSDIKQEITDWGLEPAQLELLLQTFNNLRW